DGAVITPAEYEEQVKFAADARALTASLTVGSGSGDPLIVAVARVDAAVGKRADAAEGARACRTAKAEAVARVGPRTVPSPAPACARAGVQSGPPPWGRAPAL